MTPIKRSRILQAHIRAQVKLEEARKSAAQQLQAAMKQKPRFSIDLDLDAPKVAIPTSYLADEGGNTQLLVDLGHFNVRTDDVSSWLTGLYVFCLLNCQTPFLDLYRRGS